MALSVVLEEETYNVKDLSENTESKVEPENRTGRNAHLKGQQRLLGGCRHR